MALYFSKCTVGVGGVGGGGWGGGVFFNPPTNLTDIGLEEDFFG